MSLEPKYKDLKLPATHPTKQGEEQRWLRENIKQYEELTYAKEYIQASSIKVECKRYKFVISTVYSPSRHKIKRSSYTDYFSIRGNKSTVDFNAKNSYWQSRFTIP